MFIRRCAWHPKYHGYSKVLGVTWSGWGIEFSHGICSDCAARTRAEWRLPTAGETAQPVPAPRRPLRSLRPDFALAAAVVLLAVTATFALTGVPGFTPPSRQRSAAVDRRTIDETSAPATRSSPAPADSGASPSSTDALSAPGAGRPSSPATRPPTPSPGAPTGGVEPKVAQAPAGAPSAAWSGAGRAGRARVARVRGRGVGGGVGVVPVSAPDTDRGSIGPSGARVAAPLPASAPEPPAGPTNFGRASTANRFNELQAP